LKAFEAITALQRSNPALRDFTDASTAWMKSDKASPELKSSFLLMQFGFRNASGAPLYEVYRAAIPHDQLTIVMRKVDEVTNLGVFERLVAKEGDARANPTLRALYENGKLESFEYRPHRIADGGQRVGLGSPADEHGRTPGREDLHEVTLTKSFEMQATPVTQLQWSLVMDENPSLFKTDGKLIEINGRRLLMSPNRPVERVSWDDVQIYIQKLNQLDPHYNYRLPTEAEWEYAARAGTHSPYSFGSDPNDLGAHGWHSGNSGSQPHDVASLKPNPSGLYDMHGNVWDWVQDWYEDSRPQGAVDPTGPAQGVTRVIRGGSWGTESEALRSAHRFYSDPSNRNNNIGFRLVRTPK
jgi:formylglycine-generating enzyme required for sulfatase activity